MDRLKNKVALITGAGSGIGKAIATAFAHEGAGICAVGRTLEKLKDVTLEIEKKGQNALAVKGDVSKLKDIDDIVSETVDHFGRIDILVNNAGISIDLDVLDIREEHWDTLMGTDLKGVFFMSQRVLPVMLEQGKGKIINIASPLAVEGAGFCLLYCTAKAGVVNMTRALAVEYAGRNINVNALAPGLTATPFTENLTGNPEMMQMALSRIPSGRIGRPEDMTGAAVYLASDESDFTTGATFFVDGGETAH